MLTNAVAPDKLGGLERYVRELSAALVDEGHHVTVIAKQVSQDHAPSETGSDGVRIVRHRVPKKSDPTFAMRYPVAVARAVRQELDRAKDNSLLHVHFALSAIEPLLRRRRFLMTFHAPVHRELLSERQDSYLLPAPIRQVTVRSVRFAERCVVQAAERIIVLSDFMAAEVRDLHQAAASKTMVLPGGVDTGLFQPGRAAQHEWATGADPLLVVARRLTPRTGVAQLVQAMVSVRRHLPNARLVVLGTGGQRDRIAQLVDELELGDAVRLFGYVSDNELTDWYRRAAFVITPTQALEGFGLTTAEAMACGTPVIVTPIGANPELVRSLDSRLIAASADPQDLADCIVGLASDRALGEQLRARARGVVHPAMCWGQIASQHTEFYRRMHST
jgi:glycosyltransferase involved in cell wall biosynthesis